LSDFLSLGISKAITNQLHQYGVSIPTPVQEKAIPLVMKGQDIIAQAQTGTGKTFAFILPILEKVDSDATHVQALIVTPTRELALQITDEIEKLIAGMDGVDVLAVYGGQDVAKQLKKLKKNPQIVVGTPGRLLDHIRRETVHLSEVSFLVLDEADQMLHIGFLNEVEDIIRETPASRQTMLFSATISPEIRNLAKKYMREPEYIQVKKTQGPADNVEQIAIQTTDRAKQATLIELIETQRPFLAVIFCRTKRRVSKLYDALKYSGFSCDELHGDLSQAKRERVMKRFRDAEIQLLIATDVAARGLDVEGVTHVFNYDIPLDAESFIHRIGRTGRAGLTGLAITLYSADDRPTLEMIEKELNITIEKQNTENTHEEKERKEENKQSRPSNQKGSRDVQKDKPRNSGDARKGSQRNGTKRTSVKGKRVDTNSQTFKSDRTSNKTGSGRTKRGK
jgi:ATP-dependent RNA helicase DeaD